MSHRGCSALAKDEAKKSSEMSGLLALLDDVVALTKVAAASLDDVVGQAVQASGKAAGVVIDDTAVTPRYVVGFTAERELPIVGRIAMGSLKNKILFLLPAALFLSAFAPWAITPLLMIGGVFLCFEGFEKVHQMLASHNPHANASHAESDALDPGAVEEQKVAGAIRTDFILSAEIMAISLASITTPNILTQAIDDTLYLCCFLHHPIQPIHAGDVGAKIEAQRGIDAQKSRNRDCVLVVHQQ